MSVPDDLYRSLDGFVHRNVDRLGKHLDPRGDRYRALVGLGAILGTSIGEVSVALGPVPLRLDHVPFAAANLIIGANLEHKLAIDEIMWGPNTKRDGARSVVVDESRYRNELRVRAVRVGFALAGVCYAASGIATVAQSIASGNPDASGIHDIVFGSWIAAPAFSSYLRDRDPPAAEQDPMLAYLPKRTPKPAIEPR